MEFTLDGRCMTDRAAAHAHLQAQLHLPDYYGRNLDALYDVLTERAEPLTIRISNPEQIEENLGRYGASMLLVFRQAEENNPNLTVEI